MNITCYYHITGDVQNVGYRYYLRSVANRLKVTGFVRNLPDGSVETAITATQDLHDQIETLLWKGPALSRVNRISKQIIKQKIPFTGFDVRY